MKLTYADTTHRYHLDGKSVKSASAVAKIAADDFALQQWMQRMVAVGMTIRPDLAERVAIDLTNKEAINQVVDAAREAASADAAAHRGTQRHRVLELTLLDQTDQFVTDQQRADAEVLRRTLDAYSLEPMPDRVEQFVVWPQVPIVGRYDCILQFRGAPAMFDLKSGRSAVDYPHSTVTQLALYAYAPRTSRTVEHTGDRWTCEDWTTMPDGLDLETGYVILVDDDDEVGTLYALDLTHGYRAAQAAMELVAWRREHNYGRDLARMVEPPDPPTIIDLARARQEADRVRDPSPTVDPTFEGDYVDEGAFNRLHVRYDAVTDEARAWFGRIVSEAKAAGVPFNANGGTRTLRRYGLYRGLLAIAESMCFGDGVDRILVALVYGATGGDDAVRFANVAPGHALGSLNADEAKGFALLAERLAKNDPEIFALVATNTPLPAA